MCQVHTGTYVSLLAPEKTRLHRLPLRKDYHVYITCGTYHYAYARQIQLNRKKQRQKIKDR